MSSSNTSFNELDDIYQDIILDHYRHPRNKAKMPDPDLVSRGFNPFCGDEVILMIKLSTENQINTISFTGQGCSISQASASILTELIKGKHIKETMEISNMFRNLVKGLSIGDEELDKLGELEALKGVSKFPVRIKCALLPWSTLEDAISTNKAS
jgi:nitrogen fixation NifU-like protein